MHLGGVNNNKPNANRMMKEYFKIAAVAIVAVMVYRYVQANYFTSLPKLG